MTACKKCDTAIEASADADAALNAAHGIAIAAFRIAGAARAAHQRGEHKGATLPGGAEATGGNTVRDEEAP